MKAELENQGEPEEELVVLVDKYLDQRLDENEVALLERRLRDDHAAMRYCAERMRIHAGLHALSTSFRIKIHEGRDLLIEHEDGVATVTARHTKEISMSPGGGSVASDPQLLSVMESASVQRRWWLIALLLTILAVGIYWLLKQDQSSTVVTPVEQEISLRTLENASFEADDLDDGLRSPGVSGWLLKGDVATAALLNPTSKPKRNPHGGVHWLKAYPEMDGSKLLRLARSDDRKCGWAKQKLYVHTSEGNRAARMSDLDGRTIRVTILIGRPHQDSGKWTRPVNLEVGIQEDGQTCRFAAIHRIDTGSSGWPAADENLKLKLDAMRKVTFDLKVKAKEMRGDVYFILEVDESTAFGAEVYIDDVKLELLP